MFKPKQKTLKQSLITAVAKSVVTVSLFGSAFMVSSAFASDTVVFPEHAAPSIQAPVAQGSPADLLAKHDCWTGEAPADMQGVVPGHVIVTKGASPVYGGTRLVGQALEQIFEDVDHGLTVHGFCR